VDEQRGNRAQGVARRARNSLWGKEKKKVEKGYYFRLGRAQSRKMKKERDLGAEHCMCGMVEGGGSKEASGMTLDLSGSVSKKW